VDMERGSILESGVRRIGNDKVVTPKNKEGPIAGNNRDIKEKTMTEINIEKSPIMNKALIK